MKLEGEFARSMKLEGPLIMGICAESYILDGP